MIDEKALDKAILNHYKKKLFSEFRNHMIIESQDQAQIFSDYLKEVERKKVERKSTLVFAGVFICIWIAFFLQFYVSVR